MQTKRQPAIFDSTVLLASRLPSNSTVAPLRLHMASGSQFLKGKASQNPRLPKPCEALPRQGHLPQAKGMAKLLVSPDSAPLLR